jgi:hypothetical protein
MLDFFSAACASAGMNIAAASTAPRILVGNRFMIVWRQFDMRWPELVAIEKRFGREGGRLWQAARIASV